MPVAASKRQYRMMMAILSGKKGNTARGDSGPPASIAAKYSEPGNGAPEDKGKAHKGGKWGDKKKKKKDLKKSLTDFIRSTGRKGAGCLVIDIDGNVLIGRRTDNGLWTTPGGSVDPGESFEEAAVRELKEESNIKAKNASHLLSKEYRGVSTQQFLVTAYSGRIKSNGELSNIHFCPISDMPWDELTDYCKDSISHYISSKLKKNKDIKLLLAQEDLKKNIIRDGLDGMATHELTHGEALKLVGNGTFRMLREAVKDMEDESLRDVQFDHYTLHVRKHINDVYSGRILDGHKMVHQFTNKSLPHLAGELMSVFEWYLPEDEGELQILEEDHLADDAIQGGLQALVEQYKQHNIVNIYSEMENIREEIRHGNAVDLQQVENRIMKLFDKLESTILNHAEQHNKLANQAGGDIDSLEEKLRALQAKVEELGSKPVSVQAYSPTPHVGNGIYHNEYPFLTKPQISVSPRGEVKIVFGNDWSIYERENFLHDMKAKIIKHD